MKCKCCNKEKETRIGFCMDCADCESVIKDGTDMYDKPINKIEGQSKYMDKLKYILEKFNVVKK